MASRRYAGTCRPEIGEARFQRRDLGGVHFVIEVGADAFDECDARGVDL